MTNQQKDQITALRSQGYGYKKIGQLMSLSVNTIKTYCKRNALGSAAMNPHRSMDDSCKFCGRSLVQTPGRKHRLFCSDACRTKWWNSHPELVKHRGDRQVICGYCGKTFGVSQNSTRKYCSHACYIADRFHGGELQ